MTSIARILLLLLIVPFNAAVAQTPTDSLARFNGTWEIVSSTGRSGCEAGLTFTVSTDGRYVDLTERSPEGDFRIRYIVLQAQADRVLMFIEDEDRLTAQGDPVLWWAVFSGADVFRWRRYDWPAESTTAAEWRRCTT